MHICVLHHRSNANLMLLRIGHLFTEDKRLMQNQQWIELSYKEGPLKPFVNKKDLLKELAMMLIGIEKQLAHLALRYLVYLCRINCYSKIIKLLSCNKIIIQCRLNFVYVYGCNKNIVTDS